MDYGHARALQILWQGIAKAHADAAIALDDFILAKENNATALAVKENFYACATPEKLKPLGDRDYITVRQWRYFIGLLEADLRKHFTAAFSQRHLRLFLESRVELLPGDILVSPGRSGALRWHSQVASAIDCKPDNWEGRRPVIISANRFNSYRLAPPHP